MTRDNDDRIPLRDSIFFPLCTKIRDFAVKHGDAAKATYGELFMALCAAANDIGKRVGMSDDERRMLFDQIRSVVGTEEQIKDVADLRRKSFEVVK